MINLILTSAYGITVYIIMNMIYKEYILSIKSTIWNSNSEDVASPNNMYNPCWIKWVFIILKFGRKEIQKKNHVDFLAA